MTNPIILPRERLAVADLVPVVVLDAHSDTWYEAVAVPGWLEAVQAWARANRMRPENVRRIEIFDVGGRWFARTEEYARGQMGGPVFDRKEGAPVVHTSTYVLDGPPPALPGGEG